MATPDPLVDVVKTCHFCQCRIKSTDQPGVRAWVDLVDGRWMCREAPASILGHMPYREASTR